MTYIIYYSKSLAQVAFGNDSDTSADGCRLCLRAAHSAQSGSDENFAGEIGAAEFAPGGVEQGESGAVDDALRPNVTPRTRRHLAVH